MFWGRQIVVFLAIVTVLYGTTNVFPIARYQDALRTFAAQQAVETTWEPPRHTYAGRGQPQATSYTAKEGIYASPD